MRRWLSSLVAVMIGICIGGAIGYAVVLMSAAEKNALVARPTGNNFQRVFDDMAKLYALETLAANCRGTTDIQSVFGNEANLIQNLRETANGSGLTPAIDVAESRLAMRNAMALKDPELQSRQAARAQKLLESSGWKEASATSDMRDVIVALDHEECGQTSTTGQTTR